MPTTAARSSEPQHPASVAVDLPITLGQFVKLAGFASTGGVAKRLVITGAVQVNRVVETRRGRKLTPGDIVKVGDAVVEVVNHPGVGVSED